MQVHRVQNNNHYRTNFGAGMITLEGLNANEIMPQYDNIKKIAETCNLDLFIGKWNESKYFPKSYGYTVVAKQEMKELSCIVRGVGLTLKSKESQASELSVAIYDAVIKAVESLAINIEKHTGIKPEFLNYLKK